MRVQTERFGEIVVDQNEIISFPQGLLGFDDYTKFVIIEQPDSYFLFLQSTEEQSLAFVLVKPELIRSDYQVSLEGNSVKELEFHSADEGKVFAIVTIPENITDMTANLQAPLVINTRNNLAKQVVLMEGNYHTRHNVLAEFQRTAFEGQKQAKSKQDVRKTV